MLIKKATYRKVMVKQNQQVTPDIYGCDGCHKEIEDYPNETNRLELTVWTKKDDNSNDNVKHLHFCSWRCLFEYVPKIKSNYFASLPFLYFDEGNKDRTANEFKKLIKPILKNNQS